MSVITLLAKADEAASSLMGAYRDLHRLGVTVYCDGAGELRLICPEGYDADIARMLYAAADTMAARTAPKAIH